MGMTSQELVDERKDAGAQVGPSEEVAVETLAASRAVIALAAGGEPVKEFRLIPFGRVSLDRPLAGRDSFEFLPRHARSAVAWFARAGRKLAVDYEHQSLDAAARADGLRPAAGWIGGLDVRDDGLWATEVSWTPRAESLLRSGEYRYFSPVIYWTDERYSDVAALGPVALTNDPALHGVPALAAGRAQEGHTTQVAPTDGLEAQGYGLEAHTTEATHATEAEHATEPARANEPAQTTNPVEELVAARREVEELKGALRERDAEAFVEDGMRLGKIVEAMRADWREDYLRDPRAAQERLERAPVILPPGRVVDSHRTAGSDASTRPVSLARAGAGGAGAAGPSGIDPEDLAAYERAVAAGRVVRL